MENKGLLGALCGLIAVVIISIFAISKLPSTINVSTAPSNVSVTGAPSQDSGLVGANAGEISNFTSIQTSDDAIIGDSLTVAGAYTQTGTSTFSGGIVGNVPRRFVQTMTNGTTTPCSYQNTTGSDQILAAVSGIWTSYAGAGTIGLTVGTSTAATVTSTSPLINNLSFANSATKNVTATTSTLMSAYARLAAGDFLVWKTVTSTNAGTCSAIIF